VNKNLLIVLGIFFAVVVAGVFLLPKGIKEEPVSETAPVSETTGTQETSVEDADVKEITISASEYSYNPASISLTKGEKVRLTLMNVGNMSHDLVIEGTDIKTKLVGRGKSDVVEFTVPEDVNELIFYCSIANHRALGMEGKFLVGE
jgi:plastocyanin